MCQMCDHQNEADGEVKHLKVGFIGAGGTGKTTVANLLVKDPTIPEKFRPSIVRGVFERLGVSSETAQCALSPAQRWTLQREIFEAKIEQDIANPTGIFDRTPFDQLAYALYRCASEISDSELKQLKQSAVDYMSKYHLIVMFPIYDWGDASEDGFRDKKAVRYAVQTMMIGLLDEFRFVYLEMDDCKPQARAEVIKQQMAFQRPRL